MTSDRWRRIGWFALLWAMSVAALGLLSLAMRGVIAGVT